MHPMNDRDDRPDARLQSEEQLNALRPNKSQVEAQRRKARREAATEEQLNALRLKHSQAEAQRWKARREAATKEQLNALRLKRSQAEAQRWKARREAATEEQLQELKSVHSQAKARLRKARREAATEEELNALKSKHSQAEAKRRKARREAATEEEDLKALKLKHSQAEAKRRKARREAATEEEFQALKSTHSQAKAQLRNARLEAETYVERVHRLEKAAVQRQLLRHPRPALAGSDKAQFGGLQAALDFLVFTKMHESLEEATFTEGDESSGIESDVDIAIDEVGATSGSWIGHDQDDSSPTFISSIITEDIVPTEEALARPTLPASLGFGQMLYKGDLTKAQLDHILKDILPSLAVDGQIPLHLLPACVAVVEGDVKGVVENRVVKPEQIERRICKQCGLSWPTASKDCMGINCAKNKCQQAVTITAAKWNLKDQLRAFVENPETALHVLDHASENLRSSSLLKAKRGDFFRHVMDEHGGALDPRNMLLILHYDGFAPFAMAEQHSVGYLLVQVITSALFRAKQVSVIPWFIFGGPHHLISLQPFEGAMLEDLKQCYDGFSCNWPIASKCRYRGKDFEFSPGVFTAHAVLALSVNDQPAAAMIGGYAFHGAYKSCRWGGDLCCGAKLNESARKQRKFLLPKGKAEDILAKKKKKGEKKQVQVEVVEGIDFDIAEGARGGAKNGATVWIHDFARMQQQANSAPPDLEELLEKIESIKAQRNKTATSEYITELGWRRRTIFWDLYELYGFNPVLDIPPDFMHLAMGLIKDFLHAKVAMLLLIEKQCDNFPDLKQGFFKRFRAACVSAFTHGRRFLRALDHVAVSDASAEEMMVYLRLQGQCVFELLKPCIPQLEPDLQAHFNNVERGWNKLSRMLCGFLDKNDKPDMADWATQMRGFAMEYLMHLQDARVGDVHTFSHGYRTFTSHLMEHLASYCENWNDVFEWWCFVFERFAGVLTKRLRYFNQNTGVDKHLGECLSMESAVWRHISMEDSMDTAATDASAADCAGQLGSFKDKDSKGIGVGCQVEVQGRRVTLFNMFSVDGIIYSGGRTQKEMIASPFRRQLSLSKGKPLLVVLTESTEGCFHLDVVDAFVTPVDRITSTDQEVQLSVYRLELESVPETGVVQQVSLPRGLVKLALQPAWQHCRVLVLVPGNQPTDLNPDPPYLLVDPGSTFHMVRATEHVFRDNRANEWSSKNQRLKQARLFEDDLQEQDSGSCRGPLVAAKPDMVQEMTDVGGVEFRECDSFFVDTTGLSALEISYVTHAAKFKPNVIPHSKGGCASLLHRELTSAGFKELSGKFLDEWGGDSTGKVIGDMGSGYGQVRRQIGN